MVAKGSPVGPNMDLGASRTPPAPKPLVRSRFRLRRAARKLFAEVSPRRARLDLITSLQEVASVVSSTLSVDEVLDSVATHAKRVTNTDKAIVCLFAEDADTLDTERLVVRGARHEHPESWWLERLEGIADRVHESGQVYLHLDWANDAWLLCVPVKSMEQPVGLLCAINARKRRFTDEQIGFLAVLASFAAAAFENARLAEQSRYSLLASERDRIAREMHDGLSQSLFSVSLGLEVCRRQLGRDPAAAGKRLEEVSELLTSSLAELRRYIYDLRPIKLRELGLAGAIEVWVHEMTSARRLAGHVTVDGDPRRLPLDLEATLYRFGREAVANAIKHASPSQIEVRIAFRPESVVLAVRDDGEGFDADAAMARSEAGSSIGLRSMHDRVTRAGGDMAIESVMGEGTRIEAVIPLSSEGEDRRG